MSNTMSTSKSYTLSKHFADFGDHQNYKENETSVCFEKGGKGGCQLFVFKENLAQEKM